MKKIFLIYILLFFSSIIIIKGQSSANTPYFTLNGKYLKVDSYYNSKNKSYNFTYSSLDKSEIYDFGVKVAKKDLSYLDVIKNSGTGTFSDITFKGVRAITTLYTGQSEGVINCAREILFFKNGYFFTIMLISESSNKINSMFIKLEKNLVIK